MRDFKQYFAIEKKLNAQGNNLTRAELIENFTEGEKTSLKALSEYEFKELVITLSRTLRMTKPNKDWMKSPDNKMRRKVYGLFVKKMGYTKEGMNQWCINKGKYHKPLNDHSRKELVHLVTQAELVYESFLKEVNK